MTQFKMGRIRPTTRPKMKFSHYLHEGIPDAPVSGDYTQMAKDSLNRLYMNDKLGDCVIAGMGHLEGVFTSSSYGKASIFSDAQIVSMYSAIGGYIPGNPNTDGGCDEMTALKYWQKNGFVHPSHKIVNFMSVNAASLTQINHALYLFENLMFGVEMPDAWVNPEPDSSGFVWDVAGDPVPENGHCFVSAKWSPKGVAVETWGMEGTLTYPAIAKYAKAPAGELYVVLTPEIIKKASDKALNGLNWKKLEADFASGL